MSPATPWLSKAVRTGRRRFLKLSLWAVLGGGLALGIATVPLLRPRKNRLRPPGALEENRFVAQCIKCGQCLQVCPPQVVYLEGIADGYGVGTPYIVPQEGACILCAGLPCVLACPTGALDHALSVGKDAQMGLAVLSRLETCLAMRGEDCRICRDECPIKQEGTIVFQRHERPDGFVYHEPLVQRSCVGCGVCEEKCPGEGPSITIVPRMTWQEAVT